MVEKTEPFTLTALVVFIKGKEMITLNIEGLTDFLFQEDMVKFQIEGGLFFHFL
jgi:hypothetical protein